MAGHSTPRTNQLSNHIPDKILPAGRPGMSDPSLESYGCHLIPLVCLSCSSVLLLFFLLFSPLVVYLNCTHFCLLLDAFCAGVTCAVGWLLRIRCPSAPGWCFTWCCQQQTHSHRNQFLVSPRPPVVRVELVSRMCFNSCHWVYKPRTPVVIESRTGDEAVFIPVTR